VVLVSAGHLVYVVDLVSRELPDSAVLVGQATSGSVELLDYVVQLVSLEQLASQV
jgi:hypothetical protein